eukprot:gene21271-biopygen5656
MDLVIWSPRDLGDPQDVRVRRDGFHWGGSSAARHMS